MLKRHPEWKARVLVVWEPVRHADFDGPPEGTYQRIPDPRAAQFWDPKLDLSQAIVRAVLDNPKLLKAGDQVRKGTVVWDIVALYPPGARWDGAFPEPTYYDGPVVTALDGAFKASSSAWSR